MQNDLSVLLFPEKISELAEKWRVGTPVKVYRSDNRGQFVIGILMIGCLTFFLLWSIQDYLSLKASLNDAVLHCFFCSDTSRAKLLLKNAQLLASANNQISLLVFFLALQVGVALLQVYAAFYLRIYVCSEGLLRVFGRTVRAIRWSEVVQISWRGKWQVRFSLADGRKYTWLSWGLRFPELAQDVESRLKLCAYSAIWSSAFSLPFCKRTCWSELWLISSLPSFLLFYERVVKGSFFVDLCNGKVDTQVG